MQASSLSVFAQRAIFVSIQSDICRNGSGLFVMVEMSSFSQLMIQDTAD